LSTIRLLDASGEAPAGDHPDLTDGSFIDLAARTFRHVT
jgi:hypothetical protein